MLRAFQTALVVGTILIAINYYDTILSGQITPVKLLRMLLTYLVPYCVSTYSSVSVILSLKQDNTLFEQKR
jgi:hypothetical protein